MALPFLSTLSSSARTLYPQVLSGVRKGLSSRAIERSLRNAGFSLSRGRTLLPLMRAIKAVEKQGAAVRNIGMKRTINTARLPESLTAMKRNFSYTVRVRGLDIAGNKIEKFLSYTTNSKKVTPQEIVNEIESIAGSKQSGDALTDIETTVVFGMRASSLI